MTEKEEEPVESVVFSDSIDPDLFARVARYADGHIELEFPHKGEVIYYSFTAEAALTLASQIESMVVVGLKKGMN